MPIKSTAHCRSTSVLTFCTHSASTQHHREILKLVEIIRFFFFILPLLAILLMKSVQISEVAEKFPCCIIMKTLDQRKELFKIRLYRLAFKQHVINSRRTKKGGGEGGLYKHVQEMELSPVKARRQSDLIRECMQGKESAII